MTRWAGPRQARAGRVPLVAIAAVVTLVTALIGNVLTAAPLPPWLRWLAQPWHAVPVLLVLLVIGIVVSVWLDSGSVTAAPPERADPPVPEPSAPGAGAAAPAETTEALRSLPWSPRPLLARQQELAEARRLLGTPPHRLVITGVSGVGKSALVRRIADATCARLVWWCDGATADALEASLAARAQALRPSSSTETTAAEMLAELGRREDWCMVVDGADSAVAVAAVQRLSATATGGALLVTSVSSFWHGWPTLPIGLVHADDAAVILTDGRPGDTDLVTTDLAERLSGIPLAPCLYGAGFGGDRQARRSMDHGGAEEVPAGAAGAGDADGGGGPQGPGPASWGAAPGR